MMTGRHRPRRRWAHSPVPLVGAGVLVVVLGVGLVVLVDARAQDQSRQPVETQVTHDPGPSVAPTTTPSISEQPEPVAPPTATSTSAPVVPPAPSAPPVAQSGSASELLRLVNHDRLANGCGVVTLNPSLVDQSQAQANRQAADGALIHSATVAGFRYWGENVAEGYDTVAALHTGLMASAPHRANILNCRFVLMGAGTAVSASGVHYWAEQFAA